MSENNYGALMMKSVLSANIDIDSIISPGIYPISPENDSSPDPNGGVITIHPGTIKRRSFNGQAVILATSYYDETTLKWSPWRSPVSFNDLSSIEEGMGDALLTVRQPYTGAVARTQHSKNWEQLNLLDFVYDTDIVDGVIDYGLGLNRAIAAIRALGSAERQPRRGIKVPAGEFFIKTRVDLSFGPFALHGEGIYQTVFRIHPSADSDSDYLFNFTSSGWTASTKTRIAELSLRDFTVLGTTATSILKHIFYFRGVGWDFAVENVQIYSPPLSSFVLYDTMDGTFTNVRINSGGWALTSDTEFTHQINMRGLYDSCNALRFIACHFENNHSGVVDIRGTSNNIYFGGMCKFENNSRNNLVPVFQINGSSSESIKIENIFVSHPAGIKVYWLDSNSRHLSIRGGS
ncbi:TPA: hypothetical protein M2O93_005317, partial [Klebsiella pneumoniae]|nr:hypothetical protein [Klebsiella pneumoniae]HDK6702461.1 hypothetical protein [Klebsiella pneumoniae]